MKKIILLLLVAGSLSMVACSDTSTPETGTISTSDTSTFDLSKARAFVDADNAKFIEEIKKGDSSALAEHYHSEGQLLSTNSEPVMRNNISSAWGSFIRMGVKDFKLTTTDLVGNDELLVETGLYEIYGDNNNAIDKGKYIVVWKTENGNWKIYRDIANTNMLLKNSK